MWLITKRSLILARLDQFEDPWEGAKPSSLLSSIEKNWGPEWGPPVRQRMESDTSQREMMYASCWHENPDQSAALWKLYSLDSGVAIKSTAGRLVKSLKNAHQVTELGRVKYLDYQESEVRPMKGGFSPLEPAFNKRRSFVHEREVRLVSYLMYAVHETAPKVFPPVTKVEVDLTELIEEVFVSPTAPPWLLSVVADVLKAFDLAQIKLTPSNLYDPRIE
ncbi:MAG: hypothetical protein SH850_03740 [Planctomycetaceae bacterium]|nr:hypothetical protein [Planctomycetaceae bacterium]